MLLAPNAGRASRAFTLMHRCVPSSITLFAAGNTAGSSGPHAVHVLEGCRTHFGVSKPAHGSQLERRSEELAMRP